MNATEGANAIARPHALVPGARPEPWRNNNYSPDANALLESLRARSRGAYDDALDSVGQVDPATVHVMAEPQRRLSQYHQEYDPYRIGA